MNVYADKAAYEAGVVLASDEKRTAGEPARIKLNVDYKGNDLVYVFASVLDKTGVLVPGADNMIEFMVSCDYEIVATDAGDPTSHSAFRNPYINAFNGMASVILRRTAKGTGALRASSEGLRADALML